MFDPNNRLRKESQQRGTHLKTLQVLSFDDTVFFGTHFTHCCLKLETLEKKKKKSHRSAHGRLKRVIVAVQNRCGDFLLKKTGLRLFQQRKINTSYGISVFVKSLL